MSKIDYKEIYMKRKNRRKYIRTILQAIVCILVVVLVVKSIFFQQTYVEPDKSMWNQRDGFITLSYVGVSRKANSNLISKDQLDDHLKALYEAGYKTIEIDDIINFYNYGQPLPEKALYLIFEDGRKDSMVFAEPILKKYNYKATMMSYSGNVDSKDRLYLNGKDLKYLEKSTFWELGTNGHRFSYINVVEKSEDALEDKDGDGKYDENKFTYNHYLMDYLRDEYGVPTETKEEMINRINWDYDKINEVYTKYLGYLPKTYTIMHSGSLGVNMNDAVEKVNYENIYKYFDVLFNREGNCYNTYNDSLYNLTRMQVGADWSVNKLLMEIENYTDTKSPFIIGDTESADRWEITSGVIEHKKDRLILTSARDNSGFAMLKGSENWDDLALSVYLAGREFGTQNVYLRYKNTESYIKVSISDNNIKVIEKSEESYEKEIYNDKLPDSDKLQEINDNFNTNNIEGNTVDNRDQLFESFNIKDQINKEYKTYASHMESPVAWNLKVMLEGDNLIVYIGDKILVNEKIDNSIEYGGIVIESFGNDGEIYDGIYDELNIVPILKEQDN